MVDVQRTFVVDRPVEVVREYLRDFSNASQWAPGTRSSTPTTEPPVRVGSSWHTVSEMAGRKTELDFTLTGAEEGRLTFVGENKSATAKNEFVLLSEGEDKTVVNYKVHVDFKGVARLASPLVQRELEKAADETVENLRAAVGTL